VGVEWGVWEMSDLIKREDALECFMGFDRMGDVKDAIAALPAVVPSVKPLVWLQQYNAIGEPTNFWQAADPVLNVCWHANPTRPKEVVEATRSDRILAVLELVAAPDPTAIREAALREAADVCLKSADNFYNPDDDCAWEARSNANTILALIGETK